MEGTLNALEDQQRQLLCHVHALAQQLVQHLAACRIQRWWRNCPRTAEWISPSVA